MSLTLRILCFCTLYRFMDYPWRKSKILINKNEFCVFSLQAEILVLTIVRLWRGMTS